MITFEYDGITVTLYNNIYEWGKTLYESPQDMFNLERLEDQVMGFASISELGIYVYVPKNAEIFEIFAVVAHELGHITKYPPEEMEDDEDANEDKAFHYENFAVDVLYVTAMIMEHINGKETKELRKLCEEKRV